MNLIAHTPHCYGLKLLFFVFASNPSLLICCRDAVLKADDRPNILLFMADNWGWPHASVLGDPTAKTPVFDRLSREGVLFKHAFCPVPSCSPTRSSLLTGRAAHQLGQAASLFGELPSNAETFTKLLQDAGYELAFSGKGLWGAGFTQSNSAENPVGTEYKSLLDFLEKRDKGKPFFFLRGNIDTAIGNWPRSEDSQREVNKKSLTIPASLPDVDATRRDLLAYYAAVDRMDVDADENLAALESKQLLDKTVVFYTSDNGVQLPRGLGNCYDHGTRIPLVIRWGHHLKADSQIDEFVSITDFAPTFLELAGITPPASMTGNSFVDVLRGEESPIKRDHVFVERERHANVRRGNLSYPIRGIRTKEFLYLWNLRPDRWPAGDPKAYFAVGDFGDVDESLSKQFLLANRDTAGIKRFFELSFAKRPEEELYDLANDPHQLVNVAGKPQYAAVQRDLRNRVNQWMRDTQDPRVDTEYDEWDKFPYFGFRVVDEQGNWIQKKSNVAK